MAIENSYACTCAPGWTGTICTESEDNLKFFVYDLKIDKFLVPKKGIWHSSHLADWSFV